MVVVQAGWHALGMKASGPWVPPMNAAVGECANPDVIHPMPES